MNQKPARFTKILLPCVLSFLALIPVNAQKVTEIPASRAHHTGVYDATRKAFLIYGGYIYSDSKPNSRRVGDIWSWDGKAWSRVAKTDVRKIVAPLVYDSKRGRTLMFGGSDDEGNDGKLRVLEGESWLVLTDLPELARGDASLVYDTKRDRLVLFGGIDNGKFFGDTWEFDGKAWKRVATTGPSPRSAGAMAYDSKRGVTVLYGGFYPATPLGDTWEWNGKKWKQVKTEGFGAQFRGCRL